jgi:hypothetical protein
MPIDVDTSQAPDFVRWTVTGPWPSIAEMRTVREQLIAAAQLTTATRGVFDIRHVANIPSYTEVTSMIEAAKRSGGLPLVRAYLVASAEQFGIVGQMKSLAPPGILVEIFFNEAEAWAWLHRTRVPGSQG